MSYVIVIINLNYAFLSVVIPVNHFLRFTIEIAFFYFQSRS